MRVSIVAVITCLALTAPAGCGSDSPSGNRPGVDKPRPTNNSQLSSRPCPKPFVASSVREFLAAANSGRARPLERTVGGGDGLVFSHGLEYGRQQPSRFFSTTSRDELVRHLLKRRALGDRMSLLGIGTTGFDHSLGICNFWFRILRSISGRPPRPFIGKGAIDQGSGRVVVWNTGGGGSL